MGKWRAVALTAVHVLIAIHIAQWLIVGSTLSPVEPSESMKTLELGVVNAGFVFFTLAILSTLILGRFFCGWGCHVVALQDLCAWAMKKIRAKPKPFRSRLLIYAPLLLGLYMFVWPTFKRFALFPLLEAVGLGIPIWLGRPAPFQGFESELIVQDFWATFPPWYIAIPFLAACGFACVYFLGSKGFCAYGCPYGGIFGVVDKASPGRIVVSDACEGSGHCTAVCTSNVRVHEEVRDFGAVVNPGCMKCLDCVSACPNDALSFAFAKPAILTRPRDDDARKRQQRAAKSSRRYDLSWPEEIAIALAALFFFVGFRGMLNLVPMLMAVGMALIAAYLLWASWRTIAKPNARMQSFQLRVHGRIRPLGVAVILITTTIAGSAIWSASVNWLRWSAHLGHESLNVPISVALRPEFKPSESTAKAVEQAIARYEQSRSPRNGGIGWSLRPQDRRELAFLYVLAGRNADAIAQLERLTKQGQPTTELIAEMVRLRRLQGDDESVIARSLADVLGVHPSLHDVRVEWARAAAQAGTPLHEIDREWNNALADDPSVDALLAAARSYANLGNTTRAAELATQAANSPDADTAQLSRAGRQLARSGNQETARDLLLRAAELESQHTRSSTRPFEHPREPRRTIRSQSRARRSTEAVRHICHALRSPRAAGTGPGRPGPGARRLRTGRRTLRGEPLRARRRRRIGRPRRPRVSRP
jgi:tetratricopeptide (TPR) repeat protein